MGFGRLENYEFINDIYNFVFEKLALKIAR